MALSKAREPAAIFSNIYRKKIWSHSDADRVDFYSGIGSTEEYTHDYERTIGQFVEKNKIRTIVDLGCGDFQVGRRILDIVDCQYIGVDVVAELIERNSRKFGSGRVSFICKDISRDELPDGDLCLIRQVLQHLDNKTIARVLNNVRKYPFCILTESQHVHPSVANLDIRSGAWTRASFGSGLYFDQPPFSRNVKTLLKVHRDAENVIHTGLLMP